MKKKNPETLQDWTLEEFALYTKRHPQGLRIAARAGKIPYAYKLGGQWMFNRELFEASRRGEAVTHDVR